MTNKNTKKSVLLSSVGLATLALSGCGSAAPSAPVVSPVKDAPVSTSSSSQKYKDGTYTSVGAYKSPVGAEELGVTVTLKDNIITDVVVTPKATAKKSIQMQDDFIANYKPLVLGKSIVGLNLGKVSGASLTPLGFNDALAKIEAQAS